MEFERSQTAIQQTRAPELRSGRPSRKPGGANTFPDALNTLPRRHPGHLVRSGSLLGRRKSNSAVRIRSRGVGRINFPSGTVFSRRDGDQKPRARKTGMRKAKAGTGVASREVLQVDQACLEHPTTLGSGPGRHRRLRKATGAYPSDNFNLDKKITPLDLSVQGPQDSREPRSGRSGPLLRQAASKLTARWLQG